MSERAAAAEAPTKHAGLTSWVEEIAELTEPDQVHWCDGSAEETASPRSWSTVAPSRSCPRRSGPTPTWRDRIPPTSRRSRTDLHLLGAGGGRGPTNHWRDPTEMRAGLEKLFKGSMRGRTMYVVPFSMGPLDSEISHVGVQLTDSAYVAVSMRIMTRMGAKALEALGADGEFVPCVHTVGMPLADGAEEVPWPCNETKYIVHYPEREIWSFGSGYGGNALLGKKCFALRIASAMAHDEGWLAEHMLILKLTSPEGAVKYVAGAFPSACGKTNLAMLIPTLPDWKVETVGDDIAWMRFGDDGRLYAVNPEAGFFGVAPNTSYKTNPNAMATIERNTIFTNCAETDGDVWWGMTGQAPDSAVDWKGNPWTPDSEEPAAAPSTSPPRPRSAPRSRRGGRTAGVPIDAFLFGGRRSTVVPLVFECRDWEHGVFTGSVMLASETTAAAAGEVGQLRFDPMAMLPSAATTWPTTSATGFQVGRREGAVLPRIFHVNWFRKDSEGKFLWPGFGENSRVLEWVFRRCDGEGETVDSALGLPAEGGLNTEGLEISDEAMRELLSVDTEALRAQHPRSRSISGASETISQARFAASSMR